MPFTPVKTVWSVVTTVAAFMAAPDRGLDHREIAVETAHVGDRVGASGIVCQRRQGRVVYRRYL